MSRQLRRLQGLAAIGSRQGSQSTPQESSGDEDQTHPAVAREAAELMEEVEAEESETAGSESGEDEEDEELDRLLQERADADAAREREALAASKPLTLDDVLAVRSASLDYTNELRRIFGGQATRREARQARSLPKSLLATPEDDWPPFTSIGMDVVEIAPRTFGLRFTNEGKKLHAALDSALEMHDTEMVYALHRTHPYDPAVAFEMARVSQFQGHVNEVYRFIKMAAHSFAVIARGKLNLLDTASKRTFPIQHSGNQIIFDVLEALVHSHLRGGYLQSALEVAKLVLNLDPTDPCHMLLNLDHLAIRCQRATWLLSFVKALEREEDPRALLPFAMWSKAYCLRLLNDPTAGETLYEAIVTWPEIYSRLVDGASVADRCPAVMPITLPSGHAARLMTHLSHCYAVRNMDLWRAAEMLQWLVGVSNDRCRDPERVVRDVQVHVNDHHTRIVAHEKCLQNYLWTTPDRVVGNEFRPRAIQNTRTRWTIPEEVKKYPIQVQNQLVEHLLVSDFALLRPTWPPVLFFLTLLPWNSLPAMLLRQLYKKWRRENPRDALQWDAESLR